MNDLHSLYLYQKTRPVRDLKFLPFRARFMTGPTQTVPPNVITHTRFILQGECLLLYFRFLHRKSGGLH